MKRLGKVKHFFSYILRVSNGSGFYLRAILRNSRTVALNCAIARNGIAIGNPNPKPVLLLYNKI